MLAADAYSAYDECMQYTIRGIPSEVDRAMRARAKATRRSLNDVVVEALTEACGFGGRPIKRRDLSDLVGTWEPDRELLAALADQDRIDEEMWR